MILQALADARQMVHQRNAELCELVLRADARQQQKLRRVHRAAAQDDLACGVNGAWLAVLAERNAGRSLPVEQNSLGQRAGDDAKVGPVAHRVQVADRGGAALAVACGCLMVTDAILLRAVEVIIARVAEFNRALDEGFADRVMLRGVGHAERAAGAVELVNAAGLVLRAFEVRQHVAR